MTPYYERDGVPLCREDHRWVTEHPLEAEREGLAKRVAPKC